MARPAHPCPCPPPSALPTAQLCSLHTWQATITPPRGHQNPRPWRWLRGLRAARAPAPRAACQGARRPHTTSPRRLSRSATTHPPGRPAPPRASAARPPAAAADPWPAHPRGARASPSPTPSPPPAAVRLLPTRRRHPRPQHLPPLDPGAAKAIPTLRHCSCLRLPPRRHRLAGPSLHPCRAPHARPPPGRAAVRTDHDCTYHRRHPRPPRPSHGRHAWCPLRHQATRLAVARHRHPRLAALAAAIVTVGPRWRRWQARPWSEWPTRPTERRPTA